MRDIEVYNPRAPQPDEGPALHISKMGNLMLSMSAMKHFQGVKRVVLLYDRAGRAVGVKPAGGDPGQITLSLRHDQRKSGQHAGSISGKSFCRQFGIAPRNTWRCPGTVEGETMWFQLPSPGTASETAAPRPVRERRSASQSADQPDGAQSAANGREREPSAATGSR